MVARRIWVLGLFVMVLGLCTACRKTAPGTVVSVADGDTVTVLTDEQTERKVRLNGIDAPEHGQPFGEASKQHLSALVFGKVVQVEGHETDRYGRLVGVLLLNGQDVNLEQLKAGQAWYYREYEREVALSRRPLYAAAEAAARQARRGLWQDPAPEPPWDFRAEKRAANQSAPTPTAANPVPQRILGNRNSHIYHTPDCPDYNKVSERNRVYFATEQAAVEAGFRRARNCP
jgi:endonuclease YncB( thermonuclease family)